MEVRTRAVCNIRLIKRMKSKGGGGIWWGDKNPCGNKHLKDRLPLNVVCVMLAGMLSIGLGGFGVTVWVRPMTQGDTLKHLIYSRHLIFFLLNLNSASCLENMAWLQCTNNVPQEMVGIVCKAQNQTTIVRQAELKICFFFHIFTCNLCQLRTGEPLKSNSHQVAQFSVEKSQRCQW